jgi:hypothetical protein
MSKRPLLIALALTITGTAMPAFAQPAWRYGDSWNRETFWRGAPEGVRERIDWLQARIDRGVRDGSLDPQEARRSQWQLNQIRRDVRWSRRDGGGLNWRERQRIQAQLDDLSQKIRWRRHDGPGYGGPGYGGPGRYAGGPDPYVTDYDAARYYRDDPRYSERRLSRDDYVYRGSDGRYYCKRNDGTTGLIVGGIGGAVLGNVIDGGHNRAAGTLIGGALGALAGKSIDQSNSDVRCR